MLYSDWDGKTWHTAQADPPTACTGRTAAWSCRPTRAPGKAPTSRPTARRSCYGSEFWYWYVAGPEERPRIGLVARQWRKEPRPVLEPGPYMSWDERGVADPYVIRIGVVLLHVLPRAGPRRAPAPRRRAIARRHPLGEASLQPDPGDRTSPDDSTRTASASPPSGSRTASTGCSTPAATRREPRAGPRPLHRRRALDQARRTSSAARSRGIPR